MEKADKMTVVLSTGKKVNFEFQGSIISCGPDNGILTEAESQELESIKLRIS